MAVQQEIELPTFHFGPDGRGRDFRLRASSCPANVVPRDIDALGLGLYSLGCAQEGLKKDTAIWACFPIEDGRAAIICRTFYKGQTDIGDDCWTHAVYVSPENLAALTYRTDLIASLMGTPDAYGFGRKPLSVQLPLLEQPLNSDLEKIGAALKTAPYAQSAGCVTGWATSNIAVKASNRNLPLILATQATMEATKSFAPAPRPVQPRPAPQLTPTVRPAASEAASAPPKAEPVNKPERKPASRPVLPRAKSSKPSLLEQWEANARSFANNLSKHKMKWIIALATTGAIAAIGFGLTHHDNKKKLSSADIADFKDIQKSAAYQILPDDVQHRGDNAIEARDPVQMVAFYKESSFALSKKVAALSKVGPHKPQAAIDDIKSTRNLMIHTGIELANTHNVCTLAAQQIDRDASKLGIVTKNPGALKQKCATQLAR